MSKNIFKNIFLLVHPFALDLWSFSSLRPFGGGSNLVVRPPLLLCKILICVIGLLVPTFRCCCFTGLATQSQKQYRHYPTTQHVNYILTNWGGYFISEPRACRIKKHWNTDICLIWANQKLLNCSYPSGYHLHPAPCLLLSVSLFIAL